MQAEAAGEDEAFQTRDACPPFPLLSPEGEQMPGVEAQAGFLLHLCQPVSPGVEKG